MPLFEDEREESGGKKITFINTLTSRCCKILQPGLIVIKCNSLSYHIMHNTPVIPDCRFCVWLSKFNSPKM